MKTLAIDIETYSSVDIKTHGRHLYTASPDFEILLFAYCFDDEPVQIIDFTDGEDLPEDVYEGLTDPEVKKTAYNAAFEFGCIGKSTELKQEQWECTMCRGAMASLPLGLDACSRALGVAQKDAVGKALIKYFCMPCKPTKANGMRARNRPWHNFEKWDAFKKYCVQDVYVERAVAAKLKNFRVPEIEKKLYTIDQIINDRGILVDPKLIESAMYMDTVNRKKLIHEAEEITGLQNPNSVAQLKTWLETETDTPIKNITKDTIDAMLKDGTHTTKAARMLEIRQEISKASIKKYQAMVDTTGKDGRVRGLLQFHGASRTGRWAGRMIQVHNLVKNNIDHLDEARELVKARDFDGVELFFGSISNTLSQLIRTAFIPTPGCKFIMSDFSQIEARVIAWLAKEKWRLDVFATHGKIYEVSAAKMFHIPIEQVTKASHWRAKGKIAELALGYQGSSGAILRMPGGKDLGLDEDQIKEQIVYPWREANPKIVELWYNIGNAAVSVVGGEGDMQVGLIKLYMLHNTLCIKLPSGRVLAYLRARLSDGTHGPQVVYEGQNGITGVWGKVPSYGGKFVENIVQATARDLLAEKIVAVHQAGYKIVMHVHDEIVVEAPLEVSRETINKIMAAPVSWAAGLPLGAETTEGFYYKKN